MIKAHYINEGATLVIVSDHGHLRIPVTESNEQHCKSLFEMLVRESVAPKRDREAIQLLEAAYLDLSRMNREISVLRAKNEVLEVFGRALAPRHSGGEVMSPDVTWSIQRYLETVKLQEQEQRSADSPAPAPSPLDAAKAGILASTPPDGVLP
jgi:hypothetical protein